MLTSWPARRRKFRTAWMISGLLAFAAIAPTQSQAADAAQTGERLVFTGEYRYPDDAYRANPRIVDTAQHQPRHEPPHARSGFSLNKLRPQFSSMPPETAKPERLEITTDPSQTGTAPSQNQRAAPTTVTRITTGAVAGNDNDQTHIGHATTANRQSTAPRLTVKVRSRPLSNGSGRKSRSNKSRLTLSRNKREPRSRRKVPRRSQPTTLPGQIQVRPATWVNGYPKWAVSAFTPIR